ncbi:hypothetical protein FWM78_19545 [Salmonella enterica]|nr:hypothetical protein [Salmonella enterica]
MQQQSAAFHAAIAAYHAGQPGQDKASIDTLTRYAHACSIKKLYHWYNLVKSIWRTCHVVTQLYT